MAWCGNSRPSTGGGSESISRGRCIIMPMEKKQKSQTCTPNRICIRCSAKFYASPSLILRGGGKFCSKRCYGDFKIQSKIMRSCRNCGEQLFLVAGDNSRRCESCLKNFASKRKPSINCARCSALIVGNGKIYCTIQCRGLSQKEMPGPRGVRPNKHCEKCGNAFYASPGHLAMGWGKFCSKKCFGLPKHGSAKGGTRTDLGFYVRSSWEANYARYLKWLQSNGEIIEWHYEPDTFNFDSIKRG